MFRSFGNWNVLVPFGSGAPTLDSAARQVPYRLNIRKLIFMATAMISGMAIVMVASRGPRPVLLFMPVMLGVAGRWQPRPWDTAIS